ncbi:hypothetical protein [Streptomyces sp. NPDC016845]|uniref:hypothetical protein n=1 Tax=Streptomyces sp. NPDC016845 TaxID=3364972 RepID=UPI0037924D19
MWTLIRDFVALHFYVHALAFRAAAATAGEAVRERFGAPPTVEETDEPSPGTPAAQDGTYRTAAERARYLAECVLSLPDEALTENGGRFTGWLFTGWLFTALRSACGMHYRPPHAARIGLHLAE